MPALAAIFADSAVMSSTRGGVTLSYEDTELIVAAAIEQFEVNGFGPCTVVMRDGGAVIGRAGLTAWDTASWLRQPFWSPGLDLDIVAVYARAAWGVGIGYEACAASTDWAFRNTPVRHVLCLVRPTNRAIVRIAGKLGMTVLTRIQVAGADQDVYRISRAEWSDGAEDRGRKKGEPDDIGAR